MKLSHISSVALLFSLFTSCQNSVPQPYRWEQSKVGNNGTYKVSKLYQGNKVLYAHIDNPTIGVNHLFMDGDTNLFSISDGTGEDILGTGTTIHTSIKDELSFLDLDMDSKIDMIMYGDRYFGRFKDNKFAPIGTADVGLEDPLEYFSRHKSTEITNSAP